MKASELMIGDWVSDTRTGTPLRVNPFMAEFEVPEWQPIPLTVEILEKNGFDVVRGNRIMGLQVSDRCTLRIGDGMKEMRVEMQDWGETEERKWFIEIRNLGSIILQLYIGYTHELQHALRLCRIEKEIAL